MKTKASYQTDIITAALGVSAVIGGILYATEDVNPFAVIFISVTIASIYDALKTN